MGFLTAYKPKPGPDMIPAARVPHTTFNVETRSKNRFFTNGKTGGSNLIVLK